MISRLVASIVLIWIFGFLWFVLFLPQPAAADIQTDGIVVVTGSVGRIERGIDLIARKKAEQLLVSGVDRDVTPAEFAKAYNVPKRLLNCCVTLGQEAIDTRSNAIESSAWIEEHHYTSVRLITADWHMRRARYELEQQLKSPVTIVSDAVVSRPSLVALLREYHKYVLRVGAGLFGI